jgi:hypothetical protein
VILVFIIHFIAPVLFILWLKVEMTLMIIHTALRATGAAILMKIIRSRKKTLGETVLIIGIGILIHNMAVRRKPGCGEYHSEGAGWRNPASARKAAMNKDD